MQPSDSSHRTPCVGRPARYPQMQHAAWPSTVCRCEQPGTVKSIRLVRMRNGLPRLMLSQGGIFLRRQALASGYTPTEFDAMTRPGGSWVRIRYGVYTTRDMLAKLDESARWQLRDRAALLVCNGQTVLSHSSAARFRKFPLYDVDDGLSHVTRLGSGQRSRVQAEIKHHVAHLSMDHVQMIDGIRLTSDVRTVLDVSREFGYRSGLVAADGALRAGASRSDLLAAAASLSRCRPDRP